MCIYTNTKETTERLPLCPSPAGRWWVGAFGTEWWIAYYVSSYVENDTSRRLIAYGGVPKMVITQQPWVFLLKMIILGCFGGTTIWGNTHIELIHTAVFFRYLPVLLTIRSFQKKKSFQLTQLTQGNKFKNASLLKLHTGCRSNLTR